MRFWMRYTVHAEHVPCDRDMGKTVAVLELVVHVEWSLEAAGKIPSSLAPSRAREDAVPVKKQHFNVAKV